MSKSLLSGILVLGLVACSTSLAKENAALSDAAAANHRILPSGTRVWATLRDSLSSRHDKAGETLIATVSTHVEDRNGRVVIPAGSTVELTIAQLEPATNKSQKDGKITLTVTSMVVRGQVYRVSAELRPVQHHLQGRGVTVGEVEKVGVGAAAGAIAGRVIGGNAKGAVIGGVVGAGAGTAVAVHWASRDVVVTPGTTITFSLTQPLRVATE